MTTPRLPMRKLKEILRLKFKEGITHRKIKEATGISLGSIGSVSVRAKKLELTDWQKIKDIDEEELETRFYGLRKVKGQRAPLPDPLHIHEELKKPGVTLELLHLEYLQNYPEGYCYTTFCNHYKKWRTSARLSMRQIHRAGEKIFSDYSGKKPCIVDPVTGEVREVELFVAVLGASNYTYAEATESQKSADWIMSHVRAFEYFGGVSKLIIPDQLRSAVSQPCRYEPEINRSFEDMAHHYDTVVLPARPYKPRDKAKAEVAVQIVQRWILAKIRNEVFYSLGELNLRFKQLLSELNKRPMKGYNNKTRRQLFETLERPVLKPLPVTRYEFTQWKKAKVNIDYHIQYQKHFYSVPYRFVGESVELRITSSIVEIFHCHKRIASHRRDDTAGRYSTESAHMPKSHQRHAEWSPSRLINWAGTVGPSTQKLVERIFLKRSHPEQGYRSALGIMSLRKLYDDKRLDNACKRALAINGISLRQVKSILKAGLDRVPVETEPQQTQLPLEHKNIRGSDYYH